MNIVMDVSGDGQLQRGRSRCSVAGLEGMMDFEELES